MRYKEKANNTLNKYVLNEYQQLSKLKSTMTLKYLHKSVP